jgi:hypothetical protein
MSCDRGLAGTIECYIRAGILQINEQKLAAFFVSRPSTAKAGAQDNLAEGKGAKIFKRFADGRGACVLRRPLENPRGLCVKRIS